MPTPVQRRHLTKQQFVYETLRDAILRCEFQPGERLNIGSLAKRLGVSIVPIREALRLLESEGFIVNVAHVGATIAPVSRHSILEIYTILEGLESVSTRAAVQLTRPEHFTELETLIAGMDEALAHGRADEWVDLNSRFHLAIAAVTESPLTIRSVTAVQSDLHDMLSAIPVLEVNIDHSAHQHRTILAAILKGEPTKARRVMESHCDDTAALLRGLLA